MNELIGTKIIYILRQYDDNSMYSINEHISQVLKVVVATTSQSVTDILTVGFSPPTIDDRVEDGVPGFYQISDPFE